MSNPKKLIPFLTVAVFLLSVSAGRTGVPVPSNWNDFYLPGSQPGDAGQLESPKKCDNCHGGYNRAVEPAFNWRGSMMAQAARDPLFHASLAIANQDAPAAGELCLRCHTPAGWLEGRSQPADASALNNNDRQGVQCDFCHKLIKPAPLGASPYPGDGNYTSGTYPEDQSDLAKLARIPDHVANGMYVADAHNAKRGSSGRAGAKHHQLYSPFHREAALCGSCHDVSNPMFVKVQGPLARGRPDDDQNGQSWGSGLVYMPNGFGEPSPSFDPYTMFPMERTFSEWKMSAYNSPVGVYAPQFGGNKPYVSTCQDCHMPKVTGAAAGKHGAPVLDELSLHMLNGGNSFIPLLVGELYPTEVDAAALAAGVERSIGMLQKAATLDLIASAENGGYRARVRVTNQTGHKLPSGNPVGKRMWLSLKAYDSTGAVVYESGKYNPATAVLAFDPALKVYEIKAGISAAWASAVGLPAGPSFHLALNNQVFKDNRVPPRGFTNANFEVIGSPAVGCSYADGQYWDETDYLIPGTAARLVATLYYQTLSKEYVEFLRDENLSNAAGRTLYDAWAAQGKSAPVPMAADTVALRPFMDMEAPSAPGMLAARTIYGARIDLSWMPASDNVGVVRYDIYRNDEFLVSTVTAQHADLRLPAYNTYSYCVQAVDAAGNVSEFSNTATASTYGKKGLIAVGPNPFNAATQFAYYLPEAGAVEISIFNLLGQKVATLVEGRQEAGKHVVTWSAGNQPSGIYFVLFRTPLERVVEKVVLLK